MGIEDRPLRPFQEEVLKGNEQDRKEGIKDIAGALQVSEQELNKLKYVRADSHSSSNFDEVVEREFRGNTIRIERKSVYHGEEDYHDDGDTWKVPVWDHNDKLTFNGAEQNMLDPANQNLVEEVMDAIHDRERLNARAKDEVTNTLEDPWERN